MLLPKTVENIILDYYWSHRMFVLKLKLHQEVIFVRLRRELQLFWNIMPLYIDGLFLSPFALL